MSTLDSATKSTSCSTLNNSNNNSNNTENNDTTNQYVASTTRKSPFNGFKDPLRMAFLVQAMTTHNPFRADYGDKGSTWQRVVETLQSADRAFAHRRQPTLFDGVTVKSCMSGWKEIADNYKKRLDNVYNKTGQVPVETEYDRKVDELFTLQVESNKRLQAARETNQLKIRKRAERRELGAALRGASLDRACYRARPPVCRTNNQTGSVSTSPTSTSLSSFHSSDASSDDSILAPNPTSTVNNSTLQRHPLNVRPTFGINIESPYMRKKRLSNEVLKIRDKLEQDDIKRHNELVQMIDTKVVGTLEESMKALNQIASLLQKLVDK
ncbi:hypothetical protein BGZ90_004268 [Linnemannia elongata]|nr:hypothetical protein BGZ90_004268 [Linnemannia elongata]